MYCYVYMWYCLNVVTEKVIYGQGEGLAVVVAMLLNLNLASRVVHLPDTGPTELSSPWVLVSTFFAVFSKSSYTLAHLRQGSLGCTFRRIWLISAHTYREKSSKLTACHPGALVELTTPPNSRMTSPPQQDTLYMELVLHTTCRLVWTESRCAPFYRRITASHWVYYCYWKWAVLPLTLLASTIAEKYILFCISYYNLSSSYENRPWPNM